MDITTSCSWRWAPSGAPMEVYLKQYNHSICKINLGHMPHQGEGSLKGESQGRVSMRHIGLH